MWFFDWLGTKSVNGMHVQLHELVTNKIIALGQAIVDLQNRTKKLEERVEGFNLFKRFDEQDKKLEELYKKVIEPAPMFQSGKSYLASDEVEDPGKYTETFTTYSPVADSIEFKGKEGISFVVGLIEERYKYKKLLESQHRMINRLYKLAATSVEDPGKSITEDLRKAEKWKKTLSKKFRELKGA